MLKWLLFTKLCMQILEVGFQPLLKFWLTEFSHSEMSCFCCLIKHMDTLFHKINSGLQLNPQEIFLKSVWGRVKWDSSWMSDGGSPLVCVFVLEDLLSSHYSRTTNVFVPFTGTFIFCLLLLPIHCNTRLLRKNKKSRNIPVGKISEYCSQSVGVS